MFWSAAAVSDIGTWMQAITLSVLVAKQTGEAGATGLVGSVAFFPQFLASPIGGVLADRVDRRHLARAVLAVQTVLTTALCLYIAQGPIEPLVVALFVLGQGTVNAIGNPALQSMLPELVPRDEMLSAIAMATMTWNMGRILGPLIGSAMAELVGATWVVAANAVSFGVMAIALGFVRSVPRPARVGPRPSFVRELAVGPLTMFGHRSLRAAFGLMFLVQLGFVPLTGLVAIVTTELLGGGQRLASVMVASQGFGSIAGSFVAPYLIGRFGRPRAIAVLFALTPAASLACVLTARPVASVLSIFLFGFGIAGGFVGISGVVQRDAPFERRARVLATFSGLLGLTFTSGVLFTGWLGDRIGLGPAFVWVTVAAAVALAASLALAPHAWRDLSTGDPPSRRAERRLLATRGS